jgi:hypothetical protein
MGTELREGYRIIENGGSISVTNTENWVIDTTIGRPTIGTTETGKEAEKAEENK